MLLDPNAPLWDQLKDVFFNEFGSNPPPHHTPFDAFNCFPNYSWVYLAAQSKGTTHTSVHPIFETCLSGELLEPIKWYEHIEKNSSYWWYKRQRQRYDGFQLMKNMDGIPDLHVFVHWHS